jgi:hypothetical protein
MTSAILDLDAAVIPGESAAGIALGSDVRSVAAQLQPNATKELRASRLYDFGPVRIWSSGNLIDQIGVHDGYRGTLFQMIRVGSTISEVEQLLSCEVQEDEFDNLIVPGSPGWCFETDQWTGHGTKDNRGAHIKAIFVFRTEVARRRL